MWKNSSIGIVFKTLWKYTADSHGQFITLIFISCIGKLIDLASPYLIGQIVNILQAQGAEGTTQALHLVIVFAVVKISVSLTEAPANGLELTLGQKIRHKFTSDFYTKTRTLPLLWHQYNHSGELISRINKVHSALTTFIMTPYQLFWVGIGFFGPVIILLGILPWVGVTTFLLSIAAVFLSIHIDKKIKYYSKKANEMDHKTFATLNDYISNIRTVITLRLGQQTSKDINTRMQSVVKPYHEEVKWRRRRWLGMDMLVETVMISSMALVIYSFHNNSIPMKIGNLVMVISYLRQMAASIYNTSRFFGSLTQSVTDYEGFSLVNDAYNAHVSTHKFEDFSIVEWSNIIVGNLNFSYQIDTSSITLDHLSFELKRGQKIALVGASGGGKSTLMSVMRGLYPAQNGTTEIDGTTYNSIEPLASISTLIPQDPEIFENTIRYNITLGVEHSDDEIMDACRIACFDTVIADLPNGLDSKINEKGVNLSGGQKQRLALARGIFAIKDSSLVLFDEPTSSVDSLTERRMYANLFQAFPEICLISSIHRLNLLNQFDTIWVMQNGKLVQQGSLNELLQQENLPFYTLWNAYQDSEIE